MNLKHYIIILCAVISCRCGWGGEQSASDQRQLAAVHDFTVSANLAEWGLDGWMIAGQFENQLMKYKHYRLMTRAKIGKVLKEQHISSAGALDPGQFGKMLGADYIITGSVDLKGDKLLIIAKLIDVRGDVGEIKKSFQQTAVVENKAGLGRFFELLGPLARKLSMSGDELLQYGRNKLQQGETKEAADILQILEKQAEKDHALQPKVVTIRKLLQQTEKQQLDLHKSYNQIMKTARAKVAVIKTEIANSKQDDKPQWHCDHLISQLVQFKESQQSRLAAAKLGQLDKLIDDIKRLKTKLWQGPIVNHNWLVPGVWLEIMPVKPGAFKMGQAAAGKEADNQQHNVSISSPFWIGKYEVTIGQYQVYLRNSPPSGKAEKFNRDREIAFGEYCPITRNYKLNRRGKQKWQLNQPMTSITWRGARAFCRWLTKRERQAGRLPDGYEYRLPTEAEWEYCARAGTQQLYPFGNDWQLLINYAWYRLNSNKRTHRVGLKNANAWGLFDMAGNVWEWCHDWYDEKYDTKQTVNPAGPDSSIDNLKVVRGGSYISNADDLMCVTRYAINYKQARKNIGFRIVCATEL